MFVDLVTLQGLVVQLNLSIIISTAVKRQNTACSDCLNYANGDLKLVLSVLRYVKLFLKLATSFLLEQSEIEHSND